MAEEPKKIITKRGARKPLKKMTPDDVLNLKRKQEIKKSQQERKKIVQREPTIEVDPSKIPENLRQEVLDQEFENVVSNFLSDEKIEHDKTNTEFLDLVDGLKEEHIENFKQELMKKIIEKSKKKDNK